MTDELDALVRHVLPPVFRAHGLDDAASSIETSGLAAFDQAALQAHALYAHDFDAQALSRACVLIQGYRWGVSPYYDGRPATISTITRWVIALCSGAESKWRSVEVAP